VGAEAVADDGEPFEAKMKRLTAELAGQMGQAAELDVQIRLALGGLGYGV
jgi:type I restriction enzyme M protein